MKKLYILAFSLLATVASQAQTLQIFDAAGNEVAQDGVVTVTNFDSKETDEDTENPGHYWYTFNSGLTLKGTQSGTVIISGKITSKSISGLTENQVMYGICPQLCVYFNDNGEAESVYGGYEANTSLPLGIHIQSRGNAPAVSDLKLKYETNYSVYYQSNKDSERRFKLVFDYDYEKAGVDNIKVDGNNAPVEYFNLNGTRVQGTPTPGLYIARQGTKTTKTVIK